ncbi:hypothetical protein [Aminobacter aminovorans]|uniref:Uncharacterized protein n=1 Tax=Aminobacter aminovorans TaxID=83263 RepID=A0AAC8YSD0_AMIAI|nr:hypothetical protein [Aminobacter aminovorans]AMS43421.1 hypothetical protein AA2016_4509 [Aminobacter aminovorans]MBB3705442.1 hypothetical protein [Aminobacter aminovorans]
MQWTIVLAGALSAVCWLGSALITPDLTDSYWGGPPPNVQRRAKIGSLLNAGGAFFASIAIGIQAWLTYTQI